jgi:hypothetical protein
MASDFSASFVYLSDNPKCLNFASRTGSGDIFFVCANVVNEQFGDFLYPLIFAGNFVSDWRKESYFLDRKGTA